MPRGKFLNHKGRSRQFTPVEELKREQELEVCLMSSSSKKFYENGSNIEENIFVDDNNNDNRIEKINEHVNGLRKLRKLGGAVEGLIEISNPNRPIKKSQKTALLTQGVKDDIMEERRRGRIKEKSRSDSNQKATIEATADLARLAIVRKKREAAAEKRLAAKRESNNGFCPESTSTTSKTDVTVKKKGNKNKSGIIGTTEFLKKINVEEHGNKSVKGRNGHKRNVCMQL